MILYIVNNSTDLNSLRYTIDFLSNSESLQATMFFSHIDLVNPI